MTRRPRGPEPRSRRALRAVVALAVVVAIFGIALPRLASVAAVWHAIGHVGWRSGTVLAGVTLWNLATYWFVWMAALPDLGLRRAALVVHAPTAVANTIPGGSYVALALTVSMLGSWGYRGPEASAAMVVTGVWNNFAKLGLPVLALTALAVDGEVDVARATVAGTGVLGLVAAVTAFGAALRSETGARRAGAIAGAAITPLFRLVHRPPPVGWDATVERFRRRAQVLLAARWRVLTAATFVGHVSLFAVLLVAIRATGVPAAEVRWSEALAVFALARFASAIPFTPGGLGVVELALTTGLMAAGASEAPAIAGVLVYRALTYLVQVPLGAIAYLVWRRTAVPDRVRPGDGRVSHRAVACQGGEVAAPHTGRLP